jgi:site-specific DNA-methyltransferase (adenine-specific)
MLWNNLTLPDKPYYQDSAVVIYNCDNREILPLLPKVDLVLTDPPYSMKHMYGGGFASARAFYREGKLDGMVDFKLEDYAEQLRHLTNQIVAFHSRDLIIPYAIFCMAKFGNYDLHIWYKRNAIPFTNNTWKSDIEYITLGWSEKHHQKVSQEQKSKVYSSGIMTEDLHPAQKPVALIDKYINVLCLQDDLILDPFLGSGTTCYCAKKLGRLSIGIEISEAYCEIAARRCSQMVMDLGIK